IARKLEALGHNPDDGKAFIIDGDSFSDKVWVRAKSALPEPITDHCHLVASWLFFLRSKCPAMKGFNANCIEETTCYASANKTLGLTRAGQVERSACTGREIIKDPLLLSIINEVRGRHSPTALSGFEVGPEHHYYAVRVFERQ